LALTIDLRGTPARYFERLDKSYRKRIKEKLEEIANDHLSAKHSKPLQGMDRRTARVGDYRIILQIVGEILRVVHIGPRGDIYKHI
jgi:mRNA-degrading endonuclease RelE of RelBE toxin-antitoxin system